MGKEPSETDVKKKIEKAKQELEILKEQANVKNKQIKIVDDAIDEAEEAENNTDANKNVDKALNLIKDSKENLTDESFWWGWRAQIVLAVIAFGIMFFVSTVPHMIYYWGILGAVAYIVFSISLHYTKNDLNKGQLLSSTARIIQSPILAGAIYLILIDIGSTQQIIYTINQTLDQGTNITNTNIITPPTVNLNTYYAVSFIVGFFTESAIGFLRVFSKKLLPEQPKT